MTKQQVRLTQNQALYILEKLEFAAETPNKEAVVMELCSVFDTMCSCGGKLHSSHTDKPICTNPDHVNF